MIDILNECNYCLNCKLKPCSNKGCPLNNDIPTFIKYVKDENYEQAYKILSNTTVLSGVCGKICPHTKQCQGSCVRGIKGKPVQIGELEALVFEKTVKDEKALYNCYKDEIKETNKKVAIIGGGPAGLTCAAFLARNGVKVTIYEKYNYLGGLLIHGIPEFRLPKDIVELTVSNILKLGIKVEYNKELGKNIFLNVLENNYDAIFLSYGANNSSKMKIPGEELDGVYGGNELLEYKLHPDYKGKKVVVIGGGNVAMDVSRTIKRLGAKEVTIVYRRDRKQMPAEEKEIEDAISEGINFLLKSNVVKINGLKKVESIEIIKTELIKKEGESREVPVNIENSNNVLDTDFVVMAVGSEVSKITYDLGLDLNEWGNVIINDKCQTSNPKIFAGGDLAGIKATVAFASKSGKEAANNIIQFLCS
ncbi:MAG: FAD-dependent oxidoreductase [Clostridia bacterium]|nr:FAD-dependent oxidoreductase [Clostridia bacterium]